MTLCVVLAMGTSAPSSESPDIPSTTVTTSTTIVTGTSTTTLANVSVNTDVTGPVHGGPSVPGGIEDQEAHRLPGGRWWPPSPMVAFTFLLVLLGALQAYVTYLQRKTSQILERPFVVVQITNADQLNSAFRSPLPTSFPIVAEITWSVTNQGGTPALLTEGSVHFQVFADPISGKPPYEPAEKFYYKPLTRGGTPHSVTATVVLTREEFGRVLAGQATARLFGYYRYRDVFGRLHVTRFVYGWKTRPSSQPDTRIGLFGILGPENWVEYSQAAPTFAAEIRDGVSGCARNLPR